MRVICFYCNRGIVKNCTNLRHNKNLPLSPNFIGNTDAHFNMKVKARARADAAGNVTVKVTEMEKINPAFGKDIHNSQWHRLDSSERTLETTVLENSGGMDVMAWDPMLTEVRIEAGEIGGRCSLYSTATVSFVKSRSRSSVPTT